MEAPVAGNNTGKTESSPAQISVQVDASSAPVAVQVVEASSELVAAEVQDVRAVVANLKNEQPTTTDVLEVAKEEEANITQPVELAANQIVTPAGDSSTQVRNHMTPAAKVCVACHWCICALLMYILFVVAQTPREIANRMSTYRTAFSLCRKTFRTVQKNR